MKKIILIFLFLFTFVFIKVNTVSANWTCGPNTYGNCPSGTIQFCSNAATGYLSGCCPYNTSVFYCGGIAYCTTGSVYCNNGSIDTSPCAKYGSTYPQYCSSINWCIPSSSSCSSYANCGGTVYNCPTGQKINCGPPVTCQVPGYTISGNVFLDINQNGVMDTSEACYASSGTTLTVFPQGGGGTDSYPLTTGCNYSLPKEYTGGYTVTLWPTNTASGYQGTTTNRNVDGSNHTNINFGIASGLPDPQTGEVLDQSQPKRSSSLELMNNWRIAQTFTPQVSGSLNSVVFSLSAASGTPGTLTVGIVTTNSTGFPTDTLIGGEVTLAQSEIINASIVKRVTFTNKPQLVAGQKYAIRLVPNGLFFYPGGQQTASSYANGGFFANNPWRSIDWDLFFGTYMISTSGGTTPPNPSNANCGSGGRATGLVSTPEITVNSKFGSTGACIYDPKAAFVPFKIPSFDDLKSLYYDQKK